MSRLRQARLGPTVSLVYGLIHEFHRARAFDWKILPSGLATNSDSAGVNSEAEKHLARKSCFSRSELRSMYFPSKAVYRRILLDNSQMTSLQRLSPEGCSCGKQLRETSGYLGRLVAWSLACPLDRETFSPRQFFCYYRLIERDRQPASQAANQPASCVEEAQWLRVLVWRLRCRGCRSSICLLDACLRCYR